MNTSHIILLILFFSMFAPQNAMAEPEPERNYSDVGICADLHEIKHKANDGFSDMRGELVDEGLSPYDSPRSGFTKKRYATTEILESADSCEIWVPDNPESYNGTRYTCHWDASFATQRKERFNNLMDIFETCFNYGEFSCANVYGDRDICFVKNTQKGDTMIEWGEGISKDTNDMPKYFSYLSIYSKTGSK
ncbi:MAG: hypothetical protein ACRBDI_07765 [Alphaproteobacteria bacterium]